MSVEVLDAEQHHTLNEVSELNSVSNDATSLEDAKSDNPIEQALGREPQTAGLEAATDLTPPATVSEKQMNDVCRQQIQQATDDAMFARAEREVSAASGAPAREVTVQEVNRTASAIEATAKTVGAVANFALLGVPYGLYKYYRTQTDDELEYNGMANSTPGHYGEAILDRVKTAALAVTAPVWAPVWLPYKIADNMTEGWLSEKLGTNKVSSIEKMADAIVSSPGDGAVAAVEAIEEAIPESLRGKIEYHGSRYNGERGDQLQAAQQYSAEEY